MKPILCLLMLLVVGCGEEPKIIGSWNVLVQESRDTKQVNGEMIEIVTTQYQSVVIADTARLCEFHHLWFACHDERAAVRLVYEVDSTTYDTTRYERAAAGPRSKVFSFVRGDSVLVDTGLWKWPHSDKPSVKDTVVIFSMSNTPGCVIVEFCDGTRRSLHEKWLNPIGYERKECGE